MQQEGLNTDVMSSRKSRCLSPTPTVLAKQKNPQKVVYRKYQQPTLRAVYFKNGEIVDEAADVVFLCGDGGRVKGHKVILATQYELLATVFNDQPVGEISMISVPDITSDTMKLILFLAYKSYVLINSNQFEKMKDFFKMFRADFGNLIVERNGILKKGMQPRPVTEDIVRNCAGAEGGNNLVINSSIGHLDVREDPADQVMDPEERDESFSSDSDDGRSGKLPEHNPNSTQNHEGQYLESIPIPIVETEMADGLDDDLSEIGSLVLKEWMDKVGNPAPDSEPSTTSSRLPPPQARPALVQLKKTNATGVKVDKLALSGRSLSIINVAGSNSRNVEKDGRINCPLCPQRYFSNRDWTTHVAQHHPNYKALFSHIGNEEDKVICATCHQKFSLPEDFHIHLNNNDQGWECLISPVDEESNPSLAGSRSISRYSLFSMSGIGYPRHKKAAKKRAPAAKSTNLQSTHSRPDQVKVPGKAKSRKKSKILIPTGVGSSPIDQMHYTRKELKTLSVLRKELRCSVCFKVGKRVSTCLKRHGIWRCPLCFNTYSQEENLEEHIKKCHYTSGGRVKCVFCQDKAFANVASCVGHQRRCHWDKVLHPKVDESEQCGSFNNYD